MRTNRIAIYILIPLTIISLLLAIIFKTYSDFTTNVVLSIFGSSLLSLIIAIIGYFNERKKVLYNLYDSCIWFLGYYYKMIEFGVGKNNNIFELRNCFDEWMKYYNSNVYINISQALTINKKTKIFQIVKKIWDSVSELYLAVCDDNYSVLMIITSEEIPKKRPQLKLKCDNEESKEHVENLIEAHKKLGNYLHFQQTQEENTNAN